MDTGHHHHHDRLFSGLHAESNWSIGAHSRIHLSVISDSAFAKSSLDSEGIWQILIDFEGDLQFRKLNLGHHFRFILSSFCASIWLKFGLILAQVLAGPGRAWPGAFP